MIAAGIDIGSRTIALVVLENSIMVRSALVDTGYTPVETVREIVLSPPPGSLRYRHRIRQARRRG